MKYYDKLGSLVATIGKALDSIYSIKVSNVKFNIEAVFELFGVLKYY